MTEIEPKAGTGHCHLCEEDVPTHDLIGHIRVMHPDQYGDGPGAVAGRLLRGVRRRPRPGRRQRTADVTLTGEKPVPVLYLDLDGTVRHGKDELGRFVNGPDDVAIFPEAVEMMRRWKAGGGRIIGVSNQGGIALGHVTEPDVMAAMMRTHELTGHLFDKITFCRHHPQAADPEMARCWCRKPSPGMIVEAALDVSEHNPGEIYPPYLGLLVGDRPEDQECARLAGLDFQWATDWRAQAGHQPTT